MTRLPIMYAELPTVAHTVDRAGFVRVDGKRVFMQPGEHLRYRTVELLTCQRCGRRAIAHSVRVVREPDARVGTRYFHALVDEDVGDLCGECLERDRSDDIAAVCEVARDLVEMGRIDEARALLDAQAPRRLDVDCPACGAMGNISRITGGARGRGFVPSPCREPGVVPCERCNATGKVTSYDLAWPPESPSRTILAPCDHCYGTGQREQLVDMVVPHESRVAVRR